MQTPTRRPALRQLVTVAAVAAVAAAALAGTAVAPVPAAVATAASYPAHAPASRPSFHDGHGLHVVSAKATSRREWHLVVSTKQLAQPVRVTILLPRGYGRTHRDYPSLYLFHGTSGGANDWVDTGDARRTTRGYPFVVVMPDMGYDSNGGSFFTNWVDQETTLGTANWETFHIDQLVPWVDANLRTIDARRARAIAGLSQGGFGSFSYAARHPDLFVSAASFSGAPDIFEDPRARTAGTALVGAIATGLDGVPADAIFGDPATRELNWKGHNPASIVTNLADTDLALWCGNGATGPYDEPSPSTPAGSGIEGLVHESTGYFVAAADAAHVAYTYDDYGPGTHSWPYWARDLQQYLPQLKAVVAQHRHRPASISYRSVDRRWSQWGWRVTNHRTVEQDWSQLDDATRARFTLVAANPVTVRTPSSYRPGTYLLTYRGGTGPQRVRADRHGRLTMRVVPDASGTVAVSVARR